MKKIQSVIAGLLLSASVWAQTPEKMSYQAVVRDADGKIIVSKAVGMRISILQGSETGTAVYTEVQTPQTNTNGLVSIKIGDGAGLGSIDWSTGVYYIKTEVDPAGGTNYSISGASQLLSVPYALYSKTSGTPGLKGDKGETGATGAQGPKGETGAQGPKGDKGDAGTGGVAVLSQTQIDALTPTEGQLVYNTNYKNLQMYDGATWKSLQLGSCVPMPIASNAGSDIVATAATVTLAANAPNAGITGKWKIVSGDGGSFADASLFNSSFTGKSNTVYTLEWSLSSKCSTTVSSIKVTIPDLTPVSTDVTDADGNVYKTVTIGTQVWFAENLKTTKYNDNTAITNVTVNAAWSTLTTDAYCNYDNVATNKDTYGLLYNGYAVNTGKLCPTGWHVSTSNDWVTLISNIGDATTSAAKLKEIGTAHWQKGGTNDVGFTALAGGCRMANGTFNRLKYDGNWWTSTDGVAPNLTSFRILDASTEIQNLGNSKVLGFSVRCVKD